LRLLPNGNFLSDEVSTSDRGLPAGVADQRTLLRHCFLCPEPLRRVEFRCEEARSDRNKSYLSLNQTCATRDSERFLAWVLLSLIPDGMLKLAKVLPIDGSNWLYQGQISGLGTAMVVGLVRAFTSNGVLFNPVLWSMRPELIGSCLLYFIFTFSSGKVRVIVLCLLACWLPWKHAIFEGFILGVSFRSASRGKDEAARSRSLLLSRRASGIPWTWLLLADAA
jgi:hypothetical protein